MKKLIIITFMMALSGNAVAQCMSAVCEGDSVRVGIGNPYAMPATDYLFHVEARVMGECVDPVRLNDEPIQVAMGEDIFLRFPVPSQDEYVFYQLMVEHPDGSVTGAYGCGDPKGFDMEACSADAPFGRGTIMHRPGFWPEYEIVGCENECWVDYGLDFTVAEPGWEAYVMSSTPVLVYGTAYVDGMPGGSFLRVSRVEFDTTGEPCGPVAVEPMTWDALKLLYR